MNQNIKNRIEASDTSINSLLKGQKFYIDYFQREYRWGESHIKALVEDLTTTFLKAYTPGDDPEAVAGYDSYYLGPVVFSTNPETAKKSIIDGQQRITSITLLLIYLNNRQKAFSEEERVEISELIFSVKHRVKSFNMTDAEREPCLRALFEAGAYELSEHDDETIKNMVDRYDDIGDCFPDEVDEKAMPYFIDWFVENVVIVQINAFSDENAYTIFETMNDRGLNLTPTEMLKGFVLSKVADPEKRNEINEIWKGGMQQLHAVDKNADQSFFQAWFRGRYAMSIRPGKAGSKNQDFEQIGSRFHSWFRDQHVELFGLDSSADFYRFFKEEFPFFIKWYLIYKNASTHLTAGLEFIHYIHHWGIAVSLREPMVLAPIAYGDCDATVRAKMNRVAQYIETFTVRRSVNNKKFGQTAIKYTMFGVIKALRYCSVDELNTVLNEFAAEIPQKWDGVRWFKLNGMNRKFVKHLLCRISSHVDELVGKDTSYSNYFSPKGKPFEIEHLWANKFEDHQDEFEQIMDFHTWRHNIGALILLPNGTNQSFNSDHYVDKLGHYLKENTYAQTLHREYYQKNPNFLKSKSIKDLGFEPHDQLKKADIVQRNELVQRICEQIWA
ncbi:DUF262 domain-containing protein [Pontiellaceae bacterium B12219]|nr:DUF262 domain-containing protein [Pontiellaceae bacterium B12219]